MILKGLTAMMITKKNLVANIKDVRSKGKEMI